jgi:hypothetical protein
MSGIRQKCLWSPPIVSVMLEFLDRTKEEKTGEDRGGERRGGEGRKTKRKQSEMDKKIDKKNTQTEKGKNETITIWR